MEAIQKYWKEKSGKRNTSMNRLPFLALLVLSTFIWFSSCRTSRDVPTAALKPMSTGKLLKKIEQNAFNYEYLTIKKINCQFDNGNTKTTFRVNLKAEHGKHIMLFISKLNFPVARVLFTPDSVKYVNYLENNYFTDDYSYLSDMLNIDMDFETIQSVISNNAFSYRNDSRNNDFRYFESSVEDGKYVLQSEKNKTIEKLTSGQKEDRIERHLKRLGDDALILQKMFFNRNFALTRLLISDQSNNRMMEADFNDFVKVQDTEYPGAIDVNIYNVGSQISLKARMSGFSTEKISSFDMDIPQKYDQINVN